MRLAVALLIAALVSASHTTAMVLASDEANGVIHVAGKVLCQDCSQGWNEWIHGSDPIKGSKVSLTCLDRRSRVIYYTSDTTDETGQFDLTVKRYLYGKKLDTKLCTVRLVSSPDSACNILTDFGRGMSGLKLTNPNSIYRDLIKFVLEPFYFTTPMCDKPDTSDSHDSQQPRY
ncbi:proline-rich protein 1-like [Neltuma alba]|uniref:proline-rich protein 1-like n=1 Tax=Neltuma alba TaxID=207710 RepID=UPI0010A46AD0|nr:proline-rich protein 1-like [Prosopis alba]